MPARFRTAALTPISRHVDLAPESVDGTRARRSHSGWAISAGKTVVVAGLAVERAEPWWLFVVAADGVVGLERWRGLGVLSGSSRAGIGGRHGP